MLDKEWLSLAVFLFEIIAILVFLWLSDKTRMRELAPLLAVGIFIRFLYHLIVIDWMQLMQVEGSKAMRVWIPVSAELTVWLTASYLFIQYMPDQKPMRYGTIWVGIMLAYMLALRLLHVIRFQNGWNIAYCAVSIALFFLILWKLWCWLSPQPAEQFQRAN